MSTSLVKRSQALFLRLRKRKEASRSKSTCNRHYDGMHNLREAANVEARLHDLRHTALTKLAEAGTPESRMLALAGHMSRAMHKRYSHIRMAAKQTAVEGLAAPKPKGH